ncbi:hydroxymethylbilane synthase [Actinomadura parmotrematis]|uniref:Porphobilinogen deaminase n=1 Tax=Actinomadura parmotrematis TaxID=2864039 RepID=A0ABS7FX81_9ACTN|nr:hydroxymethylbilane synthase [Actinomadura parmotrematis]MBW8485031.1 hydroxymethylbilane synthase [Actinomadura parmotrematis]
MTTGDAPLRLGTRKSLMATTQSQLVADALSQRTGHAVELVGVTTQGDVSKALLAQMGGTGVFVSALRDRLLDGEVDFAVHSLKDLPTGPAAGIALAATPRRDDPRDALCGPAKLADLPRGARVGTGSPRRVAQLRALRPDLEVVPIRGNADTRLGKVTSGELDAVVLAYAGLTRIGRLEEVAEVFEPEQMLPAPGQGSLALECRADRTDLVELLRAVDDAGTRAAVTAERTVLAVLEAGCSAPVGTYAVLNDEELHLTANVVSGDGTRQIRLTASGHPAEAERIGRDLARRMLDQGADQLMGEPT